MSLDKEVTSIFAIFNGMKEDARQKMLQEAGGHGTYVSAPLNASRTDGQVANPAPVVPGQGLPLQQR